MRTGRPRDHRNDQRDAWLACLYRAGFTLREVADMVDGVSHARVRAILRRDGFKLRKRGGK